MSQPLSTLPVSRPFAFLNLDSYPLTPTESVLTQSKTTYSAAQSFPPQVEFHQTPSSQLFTKSSSALIHQTKVKNLDKPLPWITQSSTTLSQTFQVLLSQKNRQYLPALPKPTTSMSILTEIQPRSMTQYPLLNSQTPPPHTDSFPFHHRDHLRTQPSISAVHPPDQTSDSSASLDPEIPGIHLVNMSDQVQLNFSNQGDSVKSAKSANDTELIDFLKRNTSQSPMTSNDPRVTQQSPSWLPVLEKHDIPIVVGVGVSLAFIFITVTFYSLVQKNDPLPTSRAAQRNVGVPMRHTERRVAGRTYENRAFEDDECVAVIEQNPNTSDTRAQPPGPSLVTVQIEPTFEDFQEDTQPGPESQALTVETYPEPILDTKIDLAEDEMSSLSQPSIQLQCADDWTSNRGDNHSPCQDALPPPSSLPTRSPSPSPPLRQMEGLHSSLTVQNTEMCAAPIHHSLSISPGNPPLFLSHHVSLGPTTVAVDVHLYPTATATVAVGTNTQLNSVSNSNSMTAPLFTSSLVNSQDNEQLGFRSRQSK
ncbi:uncharacterized protein [Antennarius striatus]|uniref:uncharacterized protein n=1 Tax=Antennarius striatus TaxID=241820 RepID=UPI0035B231F1